jgi:hypothetical protein
MTTTSTYAVDKWSDEQHFDLNGTIQQWFNDEWWRSLVTAVGVLDLKAPDVDLPGAHYLFTPSPAIPPRAVIESASFSGTAGPNNFSQQGNMGEQLNTAIEVVAPDGLWDAGLQSAHWAAGDPTVAFPVHAEVQVFDGVTELASTGVTASLARTWPIRRWGNNETPRTDRDQKLGQALTMTASGTLTSGTLRMHRIGAPTSNVWMEVYSMSGGLPDTLLATSDTRLASSIGPSGAPDPLEVFTFSGGDQIALTSGVQYAFVVTGDWTIDFFNYLNVRMISAVTATDRKAVAFGESRGLDSMNYESSNDLLLLPIITGSPTVAWQPPIFTEDVVYTSPDLSSLVQAWVNRPGYQAGDPILIRWRRTDPAELFSREMKSWIHPDVTGGSVQAMTLTVDWRRRRAMVI